MRLLKRRRSAGKPVDAVAEIEQRQAEIEGRGMPDLQRAARPALLWRQGILRACSVHYGDGNRHCDLALAEWS